MAEGGYDLLDALAAIPPDVHYDDYLSVGQALHHEGFDVDTWRSWVADCTQPDHAKRMRDVDTKWRSFGSSAGAPVTGGTLVKLARDNGWEPKRRARGMARALELDEVLYGDQKPVIEAEMAGPSDAEVKPMFADDHAEEELKAYLGALFAPDEHIGFTTEYQDDEKHEGKKKPRGWGTYWMTAGEVIAELDKGMLSAIGTTHDESGAWIRMNPVDGDGVGNEHVTSFRHALLESDTMDVNVFAAKVKAMNLPVAAMVYSGKRSLHAIVKVDAADLAQYKSRVSVLYQRAEANGIDVDNANKDASRMTRMPGVTRCGQRQFLAGLAQGAGDWEEWDAWYAEATDELPELESLEDIFDKPEPLAPELIEGVLRVGHKMLLSGPSKAGKSFALLFLAVALAEGGRWMGMSCRRSRVLYVNLEVDRRSFRARFVDVYSELERRFGIKHSNSRDISVWNLRGKAVPMRELLPKLVRRCMKSKADVVIIDPIYKVMTGDENSAGDMAAFANLFDALCDQAEVSVIYCHHHSKGFQGAKRAIDRASGSGVFGRDPDAILDMTELDVGEGERWKHANDTICAECARAMEKSLMGSRWAELDERTRTIECNAVKAAAEMLPPEPGAELEERVAEIRAKQDAKTAWRITSTLREFEGKPPIDVWFDWPLFTPDPTLKDVLEVGADEQRSNHGRGRGGRGRSSDPEKEKEKQRAIADYNREMNEAFARAMSYCAEDGVPFTRENAVKKMPKVGGKNVRKQDVERWTRADVEYSEWCMGDYVNGLGYGPKLIVRRTP